MPTVPGTKSNVSLNPQQTLEKIGGLITEIGGDNPPELEPAESASTATPEAPASTQAPPAPVEKPETPAEETEEDESPVTVTVDGEPIEVSLDRKSVV